MITYRHINDKNRVIEVDEADATRVQILDRSKRWMRIDAPVASGEPKAPKAPAKPKAPKAPAKPKAPKAPAKPKAPKAPAKPKAPKAE